MDARRVCRRVVVPFQGICSLRMLRSGGRATADGRNGVSVDSVDSMSRPGRPDGMKGGIEASNHRILLNSINSTCMTFHFYANL